MSPPDTNLDKQTRRHRGPLIGMLLAVLFVTGALVYYFVYLAAEGDTPGSAEEQVDGRTGEIEETGQ